MPLVKLCYKLWSVQSMDNKGRPGSTASAKDRQLELQAKFNEHGLSVFLDRLSESLLHPVCCKWHNFNLRHVFGDHMSSKLLQSFLRASSRTITARVHIIPECCHQLDFEYSDC
eukprot:681850-Amphidinium_carterae.1